MYPLREFLATRQRIKLLETALNKEGEEKKLALWIVVCLECERSRDLVCGVLRQTRNLMSVIGSLSQIAAVQAKRWHEATDDPKLPVAFPKSSLLQING